MNFVETKQKLEDLLQPILAAQKAFLVDLVVRTERRGKLVQAFVDTDEGIHINLCAEISREFGKAIDQAGLFERSYQLEVSSPGLDKPLRLLRQYHKNKGRKFRVQYRTGGVVVQLEGILTEVEGEQLTFMPEDGEPRRVDFSTIIESKEVLPW
jgi:ribosome maturation factor RimP